MIYRLYHPGDFEALYAIEEMCFDPPFRFPRRYLQQLVSSPDAATWIAEEEGDMAGFAIVEASKPDGEVQAYIQTIEVTPELRRMGVGAELLQCVEGSARGLGAVVIWLHVDTENSSAIQLYQAYGYLQQGRVHHYYARLRDALIYGKSLRAAS